MLPGDGDTIAALATPPGRGGIGIVRLSGPSSLAIASAVCGTLPEPRQVRLCRFRDASGEAIDQGIVLVFRGPHSFTGEDLVELHGHGGPVVLDCLLEALLHHGARLAQAGEFSQRAFLNGKLDLAQAEAIADLIDSGSRQAARSAMRSLQGEFSQRVSTLVDSLTELRCYVEASIDFPEEEIDFLADSRIGEQLDTLLLQLEELLNQADQGRLLREGLTVLIAGPPNAGKSSLLNRLAGQDRAIVTPIPGTTRDLLQEQIQIDGLPLHIIDTAGLRHSSDAVEAEGIRRARAKLLEADLVLLVLDGSLEYTREDMEAQLGVALSQLPAITVVHNKADLSGRTPGLQIQDGLPVLSLSALDGRGFEDLRSHLKQQVGFHQQDGSSFIARRRHLDAIERAREALCAGRSQLKESRAGELLAEELRQAQQALGEITGAVTSDDLLGHIFSSFCIGK